MTTSSFLVMSFWEKFFNSLVRFRKVCFAEICPPKVCLTLIWLNILIFFSPLIPKIYALLENIKMLLICHRFVPLREAYFVTISALHNYTHVAHAMRIAEYFIQMR